MLKIKPTKNNCYDWLIKYVPKKKCRISADKILSLFNRKSVYRRGKKLSKPRK